MPTIVLILGEDPVSTAGTHPPFPEHLFPDNCTLRGGGSMLARAIITARRLMGFIIPVDPWQIARTLGLDVETLPLGSIDGLLKRDGDGAWYVIVSSLLPNDRQRFTVAHEIGHWLLHRGSREAFAHAGPQTGRYEREANTFAAELLMPHNAFLEAVWELNADVGQLARRFGTSREATLLRLKQFGFGQYAIEPTEELIPF